MISPPTPGPPSARLAAVSAADIDHAVTGLTAALPGLPVAEHHDRLAAVQELLQRALDEARAPR